MPRAAHRSGTTSPLSSPPAPRPAKRSRAEKPSAISLFTGAGGLDLGFEAAGFETRVAVVLDREAVGTLLRNRPEWGVIEADVHSPAASSSAILSQGRLRAGDASVLIGGPPCQPFSKSGYWARGDARRLADPRADTLTAYLRVLRDAQPRAFLLENVPGLMYTAKAEGLDFLRREIDAINREVGTSYSFQVALLRAVEFGVPQDRHRVFVVGARDGTDFSFPAPTHQRELVDGERGALSPALTCWDAIGDLEEDDDPTLRMTGKWADLLASIPEGRNYLFHTDRGVPEGGLPLFGWRRRYWNFLLKLAKGQPSPTIAAQPGPGTGPFHWKSRRLSAAELMRLQTFPAGYRLSGDLRAAQRQVGNAVPSALAEKLALEIRRQLLGESELSSRSLTLLPPRRGPAPPPEPIARVPRKYLALRGVHEPHPGPGLGYSALRRGRKQG
jgi:DNA (cytosine-5)-methyltransferase 1